MNLHTAIARPSVQSLVRCAADVVLASMPLRDDTDRERLSRFGDDHWDMTPAIFQSRLRACRARLDFARIDCPAERLLAKEYIFARLNQRLGHRDLRLRPHRARDELNHLLRFTSFVRQRLGGLDIGLIDQELIDAYRSMLLATTSGATRHLARYLKPITELRRLGPYLSGGGLSFLPWNGRSCYRLFDSRPVPQENRTPRIPEPVIGALLHWSLRYVDLFSHDIFAARAELNALMKRRAARPRRRKNDVVNRIVAWIDARRTAGRGIPVWNSPAAVSGHAHKLSREAGFGGEVLNLQLIVLQTDLNAQTIQENGHALQLIRDAVAELGFERGGMDTPISIDPDTGLPWRSRFDAHSLREEEVNLQSAAYVLCAYLTGMRDSEVQAMRSGCIRRSLSADGLVERLAVQSTVYKDRGARGETAEWITIEPVDRAVAVAERMAAHYRHDDGEDGLWLPIWGRSRRSNPGIANITGQISRFHTVIDDRYGTDQEPAIPLVDGRRWRFITRQFRRTLAWYIANRPFGVVAGKNQYKHASVAMFDGYAGSSASGFRQEIEQERALGQLDDIVAHYEAHVQGERQAGHAAGRLAAEYDRICNELGPLPGRIADKGRIKAMLAHLARTLHVGHLNDCFFEPATAYCLEKVRMDARDAPILSQCSPDRCPNSCITRRHLPVWEASIAEAEALLRDKRLPRFQRETLLSDNERKRKLIAPLKNGDAA